MKDEQTEYAAAEEDVALFDLSDRTLIELVGEDRRAFLHNFCTNDIKRLKCGEGCEAFITNIKGRILAHLFVFETEYSILLDTVAGQAEAILAHLDKYLITEDVALYDRSSEVGTIAVVGRRAQAWVGELHERVGEPAMFEHVRFNRDDLQVGVRVCRVPMTLQPTYFVHLPIKEIDRCRRAWGARPLTNGSHGHDGQNAFEALRIQAGVPYFGVDVSEANLAQEANRTEEAISFIKGCYLGQEPIARLDAMGHVNKILRRVTFDGAATMSPGDEVFAGEKSIGPITSAATSYANGTPHTVALAMLRHNDSEPGTVVRVGDSEGHVVGDE